MNERFKWLPIDPIPHVFLFFKYWCTLLIATSTLIQFPPAIDRTQRIYFALAKRPRSAGISNTICEDHNQVPKHMDRDQRKETMKLAKPKFGYGTVILPD